MILLIHDYAACSIADLPSSEDALIIIKDEIPFTELTVHSSDLKINTTYMIIAWYIENNLDWFIRFVKDKLSDNQYSVDHLERLKEGNSATWKYSDIEDTLIFGIGMSNKMHNV